MMKVSLKIVFARTAAQVSDVVHAMRHCDVSPAIQT